MTLSVPTTRTTPSSAYSFASQPSTPLSKSTAYRILSFCPYYPPHVGGLEKSTEELHQLFVNHGHQVTVFTSAIPKPSSHLTVPANSTIIHYPAVDIIFGYPVPKFWALAFWRLWRDLSNTRYDIVLSSTRFFLSSLIALVFARINHLPHLHIEHGSDYVQTNNKLVALLARFYDETFGRLVLRLSTFNVSPSRSAQQFIFHFDHRPSPLIYRGVLAASIDAIPPVAPIKLSSQQLLIVFAGRLIDAKGVPDLIRACALLPQLQYRLAIIGDGPIHQQLIDLTKQLHLSSNIVFLGPLTHQATLSAFKAADIVVNPSLSEGLPTVLLEAGLSGCAIVATAVGGTAEIVRHQFSALLYQPRDYRALSKALSSLLNDASLRGYLSSNARRSIIHQFDWSRTYQQYQSLFHQYINHDSSKV